MLLVFALVLSSKPLSRVRSIPSPTDFYLLVGLLSLAAQASHATFVFLCPLSIFREQICAGLCAGYAYFGMQYYSECWCGDSFDANAETPKNFRRCQLECNGNPDLLCGGINHIELFQFE